MVRLAHFLLYQYLPTYVRIRTLYNIYPVTIVTKLHSPMTRRPSMSPAWPMTHVRRRKSMTPQMFKRQRMKTPSSLKKEFYEMPST